jgi:hypothetical protein
MKTYPDPFVLGLILGCILGAGLVVAGLVISVLFFPV